MLKIEVVNVGEDGSQRPIYAFAISAKRYTLFTQPFIASVANALNDDWRWTAEPEQEFRVRMLKLDEAGQRTWIAIGAEPDAAESKRITRELRSCAAHDTGPSAYIRVLAEAIRRVARTDPTVGSGLLAVCIPHGSLTQREDLRLWLGPPHDDKHVTSLFIPPAQNDGIQYGPHFACAGVVTTDAMAGRHQRRGIGPASGPGLARRRGQTAATPWPERAR